MTSDIPFASSLSYYQYNSQTEIQTQMTSQPTSQTYMQQQTLEQPFIGNSDQNYIQPSTTMQQEFQITKKKYIYMEVR